MKNKKWKIRPEQELTYGSPGGDYYYNTGKWVLFADEDEDEIDIAVCETEEIAQYIAELHNSSICDYCCGPVGSTPAEVLVMSNDDVGMVKEVRICLDCYHEYYDSGN